MRVLAILLLAVGACSAATFNSGPGIRCRYPSWKCDCKLVYRCDMETDFPGNYEDADAANAGLIKDLAPDYHPLEIPGKKWRRNSHNQDEFCERECTDRMNAFLSLDEGSLTDYSYSALCLNLFALGPAPFSANGDPEPCCTVFLEYGRQWCAPAWSRDVGTVRCLSQGGDESFLAEAPGATVHNVFSVEGGCDATSAPKFTWCSAAPTCPGATLSEDLR